MTEHLPLNTSPLPVKLRVEDYLLLDEAGAFDAYAKTELIEGEIYFMNAQHRPHARIKSRLYRTLSNALDKLDQGLEAIVEGSIAVPPANVPEPDIVVTTEAEGEGLIPLESVRLIVEVADTTLRTDLSRKASVYARHGIPEYWVVDVDGRTIQQLWSPAGEAYAHQSTIAFGQTIVSVMIAGLTVETDRL